MQDHFLKYFQMNFRKSSLYFFVFISWTLSSQNTSAYDLLTPPENGYRCRAEVHEGDTIPVFDLSTIYVSASYVFRTPKAYEQWTRVKFNVKKVYPYAILAAAKLKEYDKALEKIQELYRTNYASNPKTRLNTSRTLSPESIDSNGSLRSR